MIGRLAITDVQPVVTCGLLPAHAVAGETVPVRATVFREGHDAVAANVVARAPDGRTGPFTRLRITEPGTDRWLGAVHVDLEGLWSFVIEAWGDPLATWRHDAGIKLPLGQDVELVCEEGARLLERAAGGVPPERQDGVRSVAQLLRAPGVAPGTKLATALDPELTAMLDAHPVRELVTASPAYEIWVDRPRALFGSWYEFFPRSEGASLDPPRSGTLRTAMERLPAIAAMGFDVVYLPPIHPIGRSFRKGANNTPTPGPDDPGSTWAIGSAEGGHDAVHPELGTLTDFDAFVARTRELGMEVALDYALQASPDHPWVTEHPEWFTTRADGSIAYAENPPKRYQDIYPMNFDNDPEGIYAEIRRVLQVWIDHGVTAFRVDNPHTKPLPFWERIIADVGAAHPDVIFLSEAFTRPAMMRTLGAIGFQQSYTYFTWRNTRDELAEYLTELSTETAGILRPSFWPTTHDILTPYMHRDGAATFAIRAVLAATGSPTWGIYSGYEFVENVARPGVEEQIDNEKYEYRPRDWAKAEGLGISTLLTRLNDIRRDNPALQRLRGLHVHRSTNDQVLAFSRHVPAEHSPTGRANTVIVVVALDPTRVSESMLHLDLAALGIEPEHTPTTPSFAAHDLLSGATYAWAEEAFVRLDPTVQCAHIIEARSL